MKLISMIILIIIVFISCSKKDDEKDNTTSELEGTWSSVCYASGSYYLIDSIIVSGTNFAIKEEHHDDSNCNTDNATVVYNFSGLSIKDAVVTFTSGATGHDFSVNVSNVKATLQNSSEVSYTNTNNGCGFSDWALNTEKDITGKTCGSTTYPPANVTLLGLYKLVGNNLNIATFSTTSYPSSVNSITYIKQ